MKILLTRAAARALLAGGALAMAAAGVAAQQNSTPPASGKPNTPQAAQPSAPGQTSPSGGQARAPAQAPQGMAVPFVVEQKIGQWRASTLPGLNVIGANGEKIGDIRDALVDPDGTVETVVIGVGGVLGVGEKLVGVPFHLLEFSSRNVATTRNPTSNQETFNTSSSVETTSTTATRDAFVTRGGTPDHAILRVTKNDLEKAPTFAYAGRSSTTSAPQGEPGNPGVNGPPPATPPQ